MGVFAASGLSWRCLSLLLLEWRKGWTEYVDSGRRLSGAEFFLPKLHKNNFIQ